jgi:biotin transport system substrate-specific component
MTENILSRAGAADYTQVRSTPASVGIALAASLLVALCAHVSVPLLFTPVPVSLAPFAVLFLGLVLGPRLAFASLCLYLSEGAAGLPVFSPQGPGGILHLMGPTGGYLMSYPFAAALAGYGNRARLPVFERAGSFVRATASAGLASGVILVAGASWLKLLTHMDIRLVLAQAVVPFLPGDVLKVFAAAGSSVWLQTWMRRRRVSNRHDA